VPDHLLAPLVSGTRRAGILDERGGHLRSIPARDFKIRACCNRHARRGDMASPPPPPTPVPQPLPMPICEWCGLYLGINAGVPVEPHRRIKAACARGGLKPSSVLRDLLEREFSSLLSRCRTRMATCAQSLPQANFLRAAGGCGRATRQRNEGRPQLWPKFNLSTRTDARAEATKQRAGGKRLPSAPVPSAPGAGSIGCAGVCPPGERRRSTSGNRANGSPARHYGSNEQMFGLK
jgi:hypothetical protein